MQTDLNHLINLKERGMLKTKSKKDQIIVIVDRSGSMMGMAREVSNSITAFVKEQQEVKDSEAMLQIVEFDHEVKFYDNIDIKEFDSYTLKARGMTAMNDALGKVLSQDYKDSKNVFVVIVTDGQENSSKEYTLSEVKSLVDKRTEEGWDFTWMSANLNAAHESTKFGFDLNKTINLDKVDGGVNTVYSACSSYVGSVRSGVSKDVAGVDLSNLSEAQN